MKKCVLLALLFFPEFLFADESTSPMTINKISTGWTPDALFIYTSTEEKFDGCSSPRIRVDYSNPMFDHILSIALSAYHSNNPVKFRIKGCSKDGDMNATSISLFKTNS